MICLDSDAAVAAFQKEPPPNIASHRDRVRAFLRAHPDQRMMFPAVALSEYLWKAELGDLVAEIQRVVGGRMFAPAFNETTAGIAADLGRRYANGRSLGTVAKETNHDRVALKHDLLIVATAVEHQAQHFLTRDPGCHDIATFAGLKSYLIDRLPDPPPPDLPRPSKPRQQTGNLFDQLGSGDPQS